MGQICLLKNRPTTEISKMKLRAELQNKYSLVSLIYIFKIYTKYMLHINMYICTFIFNNELKGHILKSFSLVILEVERQKW